MQAKPFLCVAGATKPTKKCFADVRIQLALSEEAVLNTTAQV
jgi:hypothetical protein